MIKKCEKCGHILEGDSPICMFCGAAISDNDLSKEARERINNSQKDNYTSPNASSVKALGAFLMILGILGDLVSLVGGFVPSVMIGGTICFFIGMALFSNG